jgi:hypothetical protein
MNKQRNEIGLTTFAPCKTCGGLGKKLAREGDGEHRIAANIGAMKKYYDSERKK